MKMKKWLMLSLVFCLSLSLLGCGGEASVEQTPEQKKTMMEGMQQYEKKMKQK
jgi:ABC-type Zn uptake system ZnuABC Zn-binding protein ZnuA